MQVRRRLCGPRVGRLPEFVDSHARDGASSAPTGHPWARRYTPAVVRPSPDRVRLAALVALFLSGLGRGGPVPRRSLRCDGRSHASGRVRPGPADRRPALRSGGRPAWPGARRRDVPGPAGHARDLCLRAIRRSDRHRRPPLRRDRIWRAVSRSVRSVGRATSGRAMDARRPSGAGGDGQRRGSDRPRVTAWPVRSDAPDAGPAEPRRSGRRRSGRPDPCRQPAIPQRGGSAGSARPELGLAAPGGRPRHPPDREAGQIG